MDSHACRFKPPRLKATKNLSENWLPSPRLRGEGLGVRGFRIGSKKRRALRLGLNSSSRLSALLLRAASISGNRSRANQRFKPRCPSVSVVDEVTNPELCHWYLGFVKGIRASPKGRGAKSSSEAACAAKLGIRLAWQLRMLRVCGNCLSRRYSLAGQFHSYATTASR